MGGMESDRIANKSTDKLPYVTTFLSRRLCACCDLQGKEGKLVSDDFGD